MRQNSAWLEFNGISSATLGVRVMRLPDRAMPSERGKWVQIPGCDGSLFLSDGGHDDLKLIATLRVPEEKQTEVCTWLRGEGLLRCSDRPDVAHRARVVGQYDFERFLPGQGAYNLTICFQAQPFGRIYPEQTFTLTIPGLIQNPGVAAALPFLKLTGSGDVTLLMGGKTLFISELPGEIVIDSEARIAHANGLLATAHLSGEWPEIPVGGTGVSWTGNLVRLDIMPRYPMI